MGVGAAILGGAVIGGGLSYLGSSKAASAAESAAGTQADAQMAQLQYLKEVDALPKEYREQALTKLASLYGLKTQGENPTPFGGVFGNVAGAVAGTTGLPGTNAGQDLLEQAKASPLYQNLVSEGENALLANASATGGLRSGNVQDALAHARNQALLASYQDQLSGLRGLAGLSGQTENIANVMGNIGTTQAQGQIAQGQIWQQGLQGISNAVGSGVGNYLYAKGQGLI